MAEVVIEDAVPATESGAHTALRAERSLRKDFERKYHQLGQSLAARVEKLEQRGLSPVLDALAGIRRDLVSESARLRSELQELAEQVEQLAAMVKGQP